MGSALLRSYLALSGVAEPVARLVLDARARKGKEDPERLPERLGHASASRPKGRLVWLHGASIGEGLSMLPLVREIRARAPAVHVLATTGTLTSARRMRALLPEGATHQFAPVDTGPAVERFLDHWRPDLAIWIESEFWPGLMHRTASRGVPMALVNARLSEKSAAGWRRTGGMGRTLVGLFSVCLCQDPETAERLVRLGAAPERVEVAGNLKVAVPPPGADPAELADLRTAVAGRPVWLAASTHAPEERVAAAAHRAAGLPDLLTLIAPRHPDRADGIARALAGEGLRVARRSEGADPGGADVYLADTLGEMGLWMRLAPLTFVGGSIAPMGGHTPFEPAALGSAILTGPDTRNFGPAYRALIAAGAALVVRDGVELGTAIASLIDAPARRKRMTEAASAVRAATMPDVPRMARRLLALAERQA